MNERPSPITEAELHAFADGQLAADRARVVEAHLAGHPEDACRVQAWRAQKSELRELFDPVAREPVPARLLRAARAPRPTGQAWRAWPLQRLAAGVAIAVLGGALGWGLRGLSGDAGARPGQAMLVADFARRAAVAHAVYSPDQRRPVEVDAAHEEQLVAWLSRRMGAPVRAPQLQGLGYALEGGRLLPGGAGPVAQFMYRDGAGARLTLYVSNELGAQAPSRTDTAFRFAQERDVNVFYWVDGPFGYALSAQAGRAELARVSAEVYRQFERR